MDEDKQKERFLAFIRKSHLDAGLRWQESEQKASVELTREVYRATLKEMDPAELTMLIESYGVGWDLKEDALHLYRRSEEPDDWLQVMPLKRWLFCSKMNLQGSRG
jgi:hypothetical protein